IKMDFGISKNKGTGLFGERKVIISNFLANSPRPEETYHGPEKVFAMNSDKKDSPFWASNRPDSLAKDKASIYRDIDSLQTIPSVKRAMDWVNFGLAGYKNF